MRTRLVLRSSIVLATVAIGLAGCQDRAPATITAPGGPRYQQDQATPTVNNQSDTGDGVCDAYADDEHDGCTLREAIAYASAGATIRFESWFSGSIPLVTAKGQLEIDKNLSIIGLGRTRLAVVANGTRVLRIGPSATVNIDSLSLAGGSSGYDGAGVFNAGTLTLTDAAVLDNTAGTHSGGGIANGGFDLTGTYQHATLTLVRSQVSSNAAAETGGGIYNYHGRVMLDRSTLYSNEAWDKGGGLASVLGADSTTEITTLVNSTVSLNMGLGGGGGIYNKSGLVRVSFSTLAQNHIPFDVDGAAILLDGAASKIELRANIVWGNNKGGSYADLASLAADPPYVSLGGNVVGAGGLNVSISDIFDAADDQVSADPLLGALLTDPVYTFVYPLTVNSTALNVTDCTDALGATVTTDQRGVSRPQDGTCDAGSYERIPTFSSHCTYTVGGNGRNTVTVWWRLADPGITLVTVTVDGRTTKKAMSPTAASTLSIKTAGGATDPTYDMYSGSKRGAMTNHVVEAATCTRS